MQRILIIIALMLLCISCGEPAKKRPKIENDFRGTRWGMSTSEVKSIEKSEFVKSIITKKGGTAALPALLDVSLEYKGNVYDLDCSIIYRFLGDKLVNAQYRINTPYSLFFYYELKELLAIRYKNLEKEKYDFEKEGERTYRVSRAIFENKNTDLTLTAIYPDDHEELKVSEIKKSVLNIGYESKRHKELLETVKEVPADNSGK